MIDKELLELVRDDLLFLKDEWDNKIIDSSLRRSSNVLRNLVTHDLLGKASRSLDYDFVIQTSCLSAETILNLFPIEDIILYSAGGAKFGGITIQSSFQINGAIQLDKMQTMMDIIHPEKQAMAVKLGNYKTLPALIKEGQIISKDIIIQYIANKKGGTHYDISRKESSKEIHFKILDNIIDAYELSTKNIIYFELLSIGQEISKTPSTDELISRINKAL